jgi:hypothetical protein
MLWKALLMIILHTVRNANDTVIDQNIIIERVTEIQKDCGVAVISPKILYYDFLDTIN